MRSRGYPRTWRVGATLGVLALWAGVAGATWYMLWPGHPVQLSVETPAAQAALPLGRPVVVRGRVAEGGRRVRCGRAISRVDADRRFVLTVPGPVRPGMVVLPCAVENDRGHWFVHPVARLAGHTAALDAPIPDALVLEVPLRMLQGKAGLLAPLSRLVETRLGPALQRALSRLLGQSRAGTAPMVRFGRITLLGVRAADRDQLRLTLGVRDLVLGQAGGGDLTLPGVLPVTVFVSWPGGELPRLRLGRFSVGDLTPLLGLRALASAAAQALNPLIDGVNLLLQSPVAGRLGLARQLRRMDRALRRRLTRLVALLPALPAAVAPARPAVCLSLRLARITTSAPTQLVRFHLEARLRGTTAEGNHCARPSKRRPLARSVQGRPARRLVLGAPRLVLSGSQPALVVSHDLVNAYLAAIWAGGYLQRVPVSWPSVARHGFDIRRLSYHLPPVLTTSRGAGLQLEIPELGVAVRTLGEPRRMFTVHLGVPILAAMEKQVLRFTALPSPSLRVHVRCEQEVGAEHCAGQSRRYRSLAIIGRDIAHSRGLIGPELRLPAALAVIRGADVRLRVQSVQVLDRGVRVALQARTGRRRK